MGALCMVACAVVLGGQAAGQTSARLQEAQADIEEYQEAVDSANSARIEGDEQTYEAFQDKAERLLRSAMATLDEADASESRDPAMLETYAAALNFAGYYDLAAEALRRALRFEPDDGTLRLELGLTLGRLGAVYEAEAIDTLRNVLGLGPSATAIVPGHEGSADGTQGGSTGAVPRDTTSSVGSSGLSEGQKAKAFAALGLVYYQAGLFDAAAGQFDEALRIEANNLEARFGKGMVALRKGNTVAAASSLEALEGLPAEQNPQYDGMLESAIEDFRRYRVSFADTAENHIAYGRLLERAGLLADAMLAYRRAAELSEDDPEPWNRFGHVTGGFGLLGMAREAYRKSLEIEPEQPQIRQALNNLGR